MPFNDLRFHEGSQIACGGFIPADFQTAFRCLEEQSREMEAAQDDTVGGIPEKMPVPATSRGGAAKGQTSSDQAGFCPAFPESPLRCRNETASGPVEGRPH